MTKYAKIDREKLIKMRDEQDKKHKMHPKWISDLLSALEPEEDKYEHRKEHNINLCECNCHKDSDKPPEPCDCPELEDDTPSENVTPNKPYEQCGPNRSCHASKHEINCPNKPSRLYE